MALPPFVAMPLDILSLQLEVMECPGVHLRFPYGYFHDITHQKNFKDELYDGLIYRVFFYGYSDGATTILGVYYNKSWYISTIALGYGYITWSASATGGVMERKEHSPRQNFDGSVCSLAIELDGNGFRAICNRAKAPLQDMKAVMSYTWEYNLQILNCYVVSTHAYCENKTKIPHNGLGTRSPSMLIPSGFGTFAVYDLVYKGGSDKLYLTFFTGASNSSSGYVNINLQKNESFTVYIRNAPSGFLVHTSYLNTVLLIERKETLNYDAPAFSDNVYIHRAVVENGFDAT